MKKFIIEVLDTAEQATPENVFVILTFAFRGEILSVSELEDTSCICKDIDFPQYIPTSVNYYCPIHGDGRIDCK